MLVDFCCFVIALSEMCPSYAHHTTNYTTEPHSMRKNQLNTYLFSALHVPCFCHSLDVVTPAYSTLFLYLCKHISFIATNQTDHFASVWRRLLFRQCFFLFSHTNYTRHNNTGLDCTLALALLTDWKRWNISILIIYIEMYFSVIRHNTIGDKRHTPKKIATRTTQQYWATKTHGAQCFFCDDEFLTGGKFTLNNTQARRLVTAMPTN